MICNVCNIEYEIKPRNKCNTKGFCSYACFRKTKNYKIMFKKTFIKKRMSIDIESLDDKKIDEIFHKLKSESVIKSQPKRVKTIYKKYGDNAFIDMTKKGNNNRKVKFLLSNSLIDKNKIDDKKYIDKIYLKYFNQIENHGGKIKNGLLKKFGNKTNIKKDFIRRRKKWVIKELKKNKINIYNISKDELNKEIKKINKICAYKDVIAWKKSNIINNTDYFKKYINSLSDDKINKIYSQYLIDRIKYLPESLHNGYQSTKKGYYKFKNIDKKIFFRSSWEESVLKDIDDLIKNKKIINVFVPKYIYYDFDGLKRKYFPDIGIKTKKKDITFEIKPKSKISLKVNAAKIKSARKNIKNFYILTEDDIFSDNLKEILIKIIGE